MLGKPHLEKSIAILSNARCPCDKCKQPGEHLQMASCGFDERLKRTLDPLKAVCALMVDAPPGHIGNLASEETAETTEIVYVIPRSRTDNVGIFLSRANWDHTEDHELYHVTSISQEAFSIIQAAGANLEMYMAMSTYRSAMKQSKLEEMKLEFETPFMSFGMMQDSILSKKQKVDDTRILVEFPDQLYHEFCTTEKSIKEQLQEVMKKSFPSIGTYYLMIGMAPPVSIGDFLARRVPIDVNPFALRSIFFRIVLPIHTHILLGMNTKEEEREAGGEKPTA